MTLYRSTALSRGLQTALCAVFVPLALWAGTAPAHAAAKAKARPPTAESNPAKTQRSAVSRDPYLGAVVVDAATGRVLLEDQADAKGYPASVLKLMDLLIILERVEQRQLSFQDQVKVSPKAAKTGGSQVWLADKEVFTVDELLYALMVQSANDPAVALAGKAG